MMKLALEQEDQRQQAWRIMQVRSKWSTHDCTATEVGRGLMLISSSLAECMNAQIDQNGFGLNPPLTHDPWQEKEERTERALGQNEATHSMTVAEREKWRKYVAKRMVYQCAPCPYPLALGIPTNIRPRSRAVYGAFLQYMYSNIDIPAPQLAQLLPLMKVN